MQTSNNANDTIAAIATAAGISGIAIIRVSGPGAFAVADRIFLGQRRPSAAPPRSILYGRIGADQDTGSPAIDEVVVLTFRAPHSYTGEDVVEFQGHGGRVAASRILRCAMEHGARLAEPGEFTRRAFLHGRIDLLQAEAVADLIQAQSARAADCAVEQLSGSLTHSIAICYDQMMEVCADLEATMDFSEEELPESVYQGIRERLAACRADVRALLDTWMEGRLLREGAKVVIAGEPNVGKSTLMNRMLKQERSIVTNLPGTTRDTIEEQLVLHGVCLRLIDTAGLRAADGLVEKEGIRRARAAIEAADVVLYVLDGSQPLGPADRERIQRLDPKQALVVINKADLGYNLGAAAIPDTLRTVKISLLRDDAIGAVLDGVAGLLDLQETAPPHAAISERHRAALAAADQEVVLAGSVLDRTDMDGHLLAAEHLRQALHQLGAITGREYSEELLDSIFGRFCIGK